MGGFCVFCAVLVGLFLWACGLGVSVSLVCFYVSVCRVRGVLLGGLGVFGCVCCVCWFGCVGL